MKKHFLFTVFAIAFLQIVCYGKKSYEVWQNDKIPAKTKAEISAVNKLVFKALSDADFKALTPLLSDTLRKSINNDFESKFMPQIQSVIKGKNYKIFDEFYVKNTIADSMVTLEGGEGNFGYTLQFLFSNKEFYVSIITAGDTNTEVMISLVYANFNGKWKAIILRGEDYSLSNKSAIDMFNLAHALDDGGDIIDAVNLISVANHFSNPGGNFFKYKIFDRMTDYADTLNYKTSQKYPFPYTVDIMKTKPQVFNIHLEMYNGKLTPMIMYQTNVYIKDTNALKVENDELHNKLSTVFTGMGKNNKTVLYRTYNEKPTGQNSPKFYGFIKNEE